MSLVRLCLSDLPSCGGSGAMSCSANASRKCVLVDSWHPTLRRTFGRQWGRRGTLNCALTWGSDRGKPSRDAWIDRPISCFFIASTRWVPRCRCHSVERGPFLTSMKLSIAGLHAKWHNPHGGGANHCITCRCQLFGGASAVQSYGRTALSFVPRSIAVTCVVQ